MNDCLEMLKQRCSADMSNPNEQIVPKRIGKFVTFAQECDNFKKDFENAFVFPKTKAPEKFVEVVFRKDSCSPRYPQAEEIIDLPNTRPELRQEIQFNDEHCMPSSSRNRYDFPIRPMRRRIEPKRLIKLRKVDKTGIRMYYKELLPMVQRKQIDDLTTLCKEKMSISTKETEKMDEDSND